MVKNVSNREKEVLAQVEKFKTRHFVMVKSEIKELPNILWEDETIEDVAAGLYNSSPSLVVCTNKRVFMVDKKMLGGLTVEDFPFDRISSIQYQTGFIYGTITFFSSGNKAVIKNVDKTAARRFSEYVRARITGKTEHASFKESSTSSRGIPIEQLERLAALKEKGILTDEEFQAEKKKILG